MEKIRKARIAEVVVGLALVVVAVVALSSAQVRPSPALRNYQNRIRATQILLEAERLDLGGG